jgi:predicted heme/steroid binding protein
MVRLGSPVATVKSPATWLSGESAPDPVGRAAAAARRVAVDVLQVLEGLVAAAAVASVGVVVEVSHAHPHVRDGGHHAGNDRGRDGSPERGHLGPHGPRGVHEEVHVGLLDVGGEDERVLVRLGGFQEGHDEEEVALRARVGCRVERIRARADLDEVRDAVAVRVFVVGVQALGVLPLVGQSVVVAVHVPEVGHRVPVRVHGRRVHVRVARLGGVGDGVAVRVMVPEIGSSVLVRVHPGLAAVMDRVVVRVDVHVVRDGVVVGVRGVRGNVPDLVRVEDGVAVVVQVPEILLAVQVQVRGALGLVVDAVAVAVHVLEVGRAVAVRVLGRPAGDVARLREVRDPVAVRVLILVVGRAVVVRVRGLSRSVLALLLVRYGVAVGVVACQDLAVIVAVAVIAEPVRVEQPVGSAGQSAAKDPHHHTYVEGSYCVHSLLLKTD